MPELDVPAWLHCLTSGDSVNLTLSSGCATGRQCCIWCSLPAYVADLLLPSSCTCGPSQRECRAPHLRCGLCCPPLRQFAQPEHARQGCEACQLCMVQGLHTCLLALPVLPATP